MQEVFADTLTPWRDALLSVKYISLWPLRVSNIYFLPKEALDC